MDRTLLRAESYDFQTLVGKVTIERVQRVLNIELYAWQELIGGKQGKRKESQYIPRSVDDGSGFEDGTHTHCVSHLVICLSV